jgi:ABC-type branched-subunit amino acid transport system ATPase component/ABC-type branched-subunit amino acid transport system permease subunit
VTPRRVVFASLVLGLAVFPWIHGIPYSFVVDANVAGRYTIIAVSLVILTGWVGQISLGQGAFVGIGAFTTGILARQFHIPFPANLPIVAILTAGVAAVLGLVALRVRGLYLAVATLIFAWLADAFLFTQPWFVGAGGASTIDNRPIGVTGTATRFDLSHDQVFWLVTLAAVTAALYAAVNIRDSKTGRAFFAVRGSEMAAVSLGIDVTRYKLMAFALSGALAGIAGNLFMTATRTATPVTFRFTVSLFYLGITVVGGITSLLGAVLASVLFAGLSEIFFRFRFLNGYLDIVTVGLLLLVLLVYPGGFGAMAERVGYHARRVGAFIAKRGRKILVRIKPARAAAAERRAETNGHRGGIFVHALAPLRIAWGRFPIRSKPKVLRRSLDLPKLNVLEPEPTVEELAVVGAAAAEMGARHDWRVLELKDYPLPHARTDRAPVLDAEHIVVRFGGLTAVNDVSVTVREHEIVGLIGPNGAGKTTTFNAISGLNEPTEGTVRLFGEDATHLPVHVRAQMGVGRTFQLIQLFPQLSVFENLLVATHAHNQTGLVSHLLLTDRAIRAEAEGRQHVRQVVALLGLEDVADRRIAGLPFGVLRQVEIARALVTQAPFLMLDEPASGLDNAETDELAQLLYFIRAELGVSVLLIEHDVRMVTSVCDYMYVINRGAPLAEGTPAEIQRNPDVIAAYLGEAEPATQEVGV